MSFSKEPLIAVGALAAIGVHLALRFGGAVDVQAWGVAAPTLPLLAALILGGIPLVWELGRRLLARELSSDLLAGISIVTAWILSEHLAGVLVVLMLSGGQTLEAFAVRRASSALEALARRLPSRAHLKRGGDLVDVPLEEIAVGDEVVVLPHEACPVDGVVVEGRSTMDEAYLTGEPYLLAKAAGAEVLSGAVNGDGALTVRATHTATDSRYAKIMEVMRESEQRRPRLRRLGDQLGAVYTPCASWPCWWWRPPAPC